MEYFPSSHTSCQQYRCRDQEVWQEKCYAYELGVHLINISERQAFSTPTPRIGRHRHPLHDASDSRFPCGDVNSSGDTRELVARAIREFVNI